MTAEDPSRPSVLIFEPIHADAVALLREKAEVVWATSLDEEVLLSQVAEVDGIVVRAAGQVTRRLMAAAPRLKVVGRHGAGVDNIDLDAARDLGVVVVNTPDAVTEPVAEHCLALMLALSKKIVRADEAVRRGQWQARFEYIGTELRGKTLGVVGFGRIGQRLATLCHRALEMPILYYDMVACPAAEAELVARRVPLAELLAEADVVSIHVPLLPGTVHLIGEAELRRLKPTALLINTSRGPVVDQSALVQALQAGRFAGAGLDVFDPEPLAVDNPLAGLENVVLTPHMASHTHEGLRRMALVVEDVLAVLEGCEPRYRVTG
jgi:D-3-phosphoglycerate dehydrogenase